MESALFKIIWVIFGFLCSGKIIFFITFNYHKYSNQLNLVYMAQRKALKKKTIVFFWIAQKIFIHANTLP